MILNIGWEEDDRGLNVKRFAGRIKDGVDGGY